MLQNAFCADVWRQHHDELAGFMAAMAPDGAAQAVNLTGLTLKGEMDMALHIGQYRSVMLTSPHATCCAAWASARGFCGKQELCMAHQSDAPCLAPAMTC